MLRVGRPGANKQNYLGVGIAAASSNRPLPAPVRGCCFLVRETYPFCFLMVSAIFRAPPKQSCLIQDDDAKRTDAFQMLIGFPSSRSEKYAVKLYWPTFRFSLDWLSTACWQLTTLRSALPGNALSSGIFPPPPRCPQRKRSYQPVIEQRFW